MTLRVNKAIKSVSFAASKYRRPMRRRRPATYIPTVNLGFVTNSRQASKLRNIDGDIVLKIASKQRICPEIAKTKFIIPFNAAASVRRRQHCKKLEGPLVIRTCLQVVLHLHFEIQKILPDRREVHLDFFNRPVVNVAEDTHRNAVKAFQELRQIVRANFLLKAY